MLALQVHRNSGDAPGRSTLPDSQLYMCNPTVRVRHSFLVFFPSLLLPSLSPPFLLSHPLAVGNGSLQGFSFYAKKWGEIHLENISPIMFNDQAFEQLVLDEVNYFTSIFLSFFLPSFYFCCLFFPLYLYLMYFISSQGRKRMIKALVLHNEETFSDIISGKGGACIFLLHGPPGMCGEIEKRVEKKKENEG